MPADPPFPLYAGESLNAWHRRTSPEFPGLAQQGFLPLLPVTCFRRWTEAGPLDAEERILGSLLRNAEALILPPLRHCPRQDPEQAFTVPVSVGWDLLTDLLRSVQAGGFRKCVLLHAHPLLADWLDCGLRDLRIETGMGLYRISLEGLGCDLRQPEVREALTPLLAGTASEAPPLLNTAAKSLNLFLKEIAGHPNPPPLRSA